MVAHDKAGVPAAGQPGRRSERKAEIKTSPLSHHPRYRLDKLHASRGATFSPAVSKPNILVNYWLANSREWNFRCGSFGMCWGGRGSNVQAVAGAAHISISTNLPVGSVAVSTMRVNICTVQCLASCHEG